MPSKGARSKRRTTRLIHAARQYTDYGFVNPAVYHASTVLAPDLATYESGKRPYTYAVYGTPTTRALEAAMCELQGAHGCRLAPSGLAAISCVLLAFSRSGGHILISDSVYGPTRRMATGMLARLGVEAEFYDPRITAADLAGLMRPQTTLLFLESPGSNTFEVQDVPALTAVAKERGVACAIDDTWPAGWFFDSLGAGCDVSIQAATKYQVGHSDALMGTVCYTRDAASAIETAHTELGLCVSGDDAYLTLRGLRTMEVRLERHQKNALKVASWLKERPEVEEVFYPALPGAPDHELWKRDFTGASGLFSIALKPVPEKALHAFTDGLELFGIGASWGGYESLILRFDPHRAGARTATRWPLDGPLLRLHIGLEDPDDLIADLDAGFGRMKEAS